MQALAGLPVFQKESLNFSQALRNDNIDHTDCYCYLCNVQEFINLVGNNATSEATSLELEEYDKQAKISISSLLKAIDSEQADTRHKFAMHGIQQDVVEFLKLIILGRLSYSEWKMHDHRQMYPHMNMYSLCKFTTESCFRCQECGLSTYPTGTDTNILTELSLHFSVDSFSNRVGYDTSEVMPHVDFRDCIKLQ